MLRVIARSLVGMLVITAFAIWVSSDNTPPPAQPAIQAAIDGTVGEYQSVTDLTKVEKKGEAWDGRWQITSSSLIVVAPHGGGIEARTSEIADSIAGTDHTKCIFEGLLSSGNYRMHVSSTRWDYEPCRILIKQRTHALSIHGTSGYPGEVVYIGGRDTATGAELGAALEAAGFVVVRPAPSGLDGTEPANFVNDDADLAGVQLELTYNLRLALFPTKGGAASTRGTAFVNAIRSVYA